MTPLGLPWGFHVGSGSQVIPMSPSSPLTGSPIASCIPAWAGTGATVLLAPCATADRLAEAHWSVSQPESGR